MPFQPVPRGASLVINQSYYGEPLVNVLHFDMAAPSTSVQDLTNLATTVASAWRNNILPVQNQNLSIQSFVATDLSTIGGGQSTIAASATDDGGVVGQGLPASIALCATLRTARIGRSFRGRVYFAGMSELEIDGNVVGEPFFTGWRTALAGFYTDFFNTTEGPVWCVLSRQNQNVVRPTGVLTPIQLAEFRNPRVDSQRRRLPGR